MAKRILCYGDSNTYGQIPLNPMARKRHPQSIRWTGVLQSLGQGSLEVIEEGLNRRTTGPEDALRPGRNGLQYFIPCFESHSPVDLIIFMLGTNDLKKGYRPDAESITERMRTIVLTAKEIAAEFSFKSEILLLAPVIPKRKFISEEYHYDDLEAVARAMNTAYEKMAKVEKVHFLDASHVAEASVEDGLHLEPEEHLKLAQKLFKTIQNIL